MNQGSQRLAALADNKRARVLLKTLWITDPQVREEIHQRCKEDFFFWAEHFCWALDQQTTTEFSEINLVLFGFQREMAQVAIDEIWRCVRDPNARWNAAADKARGMAATFTWLLIVQWFAQFHGVSTVITSKTEDDVDKPNDMNTPFERIRWQMERQWEQAPWLFPFGFDFNDKSMNKTKLINFGNGGQIAGMAPTPKAMRQARALIWIGDEYAYVERDYEVWEAAAGTVRVRVLLSTPKDPYCKYHRVVFKKDNEECTVFELDWWLHEDRAVGMYFKPDGSRSSPWFDEICRTNSKQVVAREYLRDHNESIGGRVFFMFRNESCDSHLGTDLSVRTVYRTWDPGLTFAVTWGQKDSKGHLRLLHELAMSNAKASDTDTLLNQVAEKVLKITEREFNEHEIIDIGDPYASRKQIASQEKTEYELLDENWDIRVQSKFIFDIPAHERRKKGIEILSDLMTTTIEATGKPALLINPEKCPITMEAIRGGYKRVVDPSGEEDDDIVKAHPFNDVIDCWRYLAIKHFYQKNNGNIPKRPERQPMKWRRTQRRNQYYA